MSQRLDIQAICASVVVLSGLFTEPAPTVAAPLVHYESTFVFTKLCTVQGLACASVASPVQSVQYSVGTPVGSAFTSASGSAMTAGEYIGPLASPALHSYADATTNPASWSHAYVSMLQGYQWSGPDQKISWEADLDFQLTPKAGLARVRADFWLIDASFIPLDDPTANIFPIDNIVHNPFTDVTPCNVPGILGYSQYGLSGSGAGSAVLSLGTTCTGTDFVAKQGQQFYLFATLTTDGFIGGTSDALNTLRTRLSADTSPEDASFIASHLRSASSSVPEPATWLFLIAGFGFVGTRLRRTAAAA